MIARRTFLGIMTGGLLDLKAARALGLTIPQSGSSGRPR
jgi:hypothetical protein